MHNPMSLPKNVKLEKVPCPLGCEKADEIVLVGRDLTHDLPGEFDVVKCGHCNLLRTNPRPTPGTIGFYYPDDYGPYEGTKVTQVKPVSRIKQLLKSLAKGVIDFNTNRLPPMTPGRMLEVGCASGNFLHHMANKGWHVQGIEFSEKAAKAASERGYPVYAGSLETAPPPDESLDLIVGWMVLEHLHDPVGCLHKLREWAKPDTWLVLSVPNAAALEFRLFKEKWYALQLPNHLFHFTPETLAALLMAGGWEIKKIHHQRVLGNLIASIGYVLQDKGYAALGERFIEYPVRPGRWKHALYPLAWCLSLFGQTGRMTVWARVK